MQVRFITRGYKYDRTAISKNSFEAYIDGNQFLVMRTKDQIAKSHVNIEEGETRITDGKREWLITSVSFMPKCPRYLVAKVKEVKP